MSEKRTIAVVAGNEREFRQCEERAMKVNRWIYVRSVDSLRGLRSYKVIRYGGWYKRRDLDEIEAEIKNAMLAGNCHD